MKFSLYRDSFAKILKKIDSVCAIKGSFAALSSCLIEARNNRIIVTATDLDIILRIVETSASISEEGCIMINARRLLDTVQNQAPGSEIRLTSESAQALIEAGNFKARIPTGDLSEYPSIPPFEIRNTLTMPALAFKKLIDKVYFSISKDDSRPEFTGALLSVNQNGKLMMVSTDGHRLSRAEGAIDVNGAFPDVLEAGVILPRKALAELTKNLVEGDISLDIASNKMLIHAGSMMFCSNLVAGHFPDFSSVIPPQLDHKAIVGRDDFQQILKRASIFTAKAGTIRLTMSRNQLDISTFDIKSGEMRDFVEAEYEGMGVTAGFNWRYIDEILQVIDGDRVSMEIIDMDSPAVIRDVTTDKYDFIVMPMQL